MNNYKNKVAKFTASSIAIFAFGIFIGYQLNYGTISSIQGYLFNAASEASSSNASSSNASSSNASSSNASSSNASSITDNIIYLQTFSLDNTSATQGDKVNVVITTRGACNSAATIVFKNTNGITFTAQVQDITGSPYIVIPSSAVATTYSVTDILLVGTNSDNSTFTKQYSLSGVNSYNFDTTLKVIAKEITNTEVSNNPLTLNSISLASSSAKIGDKVYLNINTSEKLNSLKLIFTSTDEKTFTVYAKELTTSKPYFEIPSSVVEGTYSLTNAILSTTQSSSIYSKDGEKDTQKFDFNSIIEIQDEIESAYIFNNEDINSEIITKLYNAPNDSEITINADSNTLIDKELFNAIKGQDKKLTINYKNNQIIFNGNDITSSKTIDISMTIDTVSSNENINKLVSNGIVVNFPDNGNLPGKALIRIKVTDEIDKVLNDKVLVYVYNESTNDFCVINTNVKKTSDGYYEFTITHNSDYLIVNNKLDSKLVVQSSGDIVNFQKGNNTLLMLISIGIVVIIATVIIIFIQKKKRSGPQKDK